MIVRVTAAGFRGVFCCLVFGIGLASAAELPRYRIDARIDTAAHVITAQQAVTYTNNSDKPLDEVYFHIYPHRAYTQKEIRTLYRYAGYFKINPFPEGFQSGDLTVGSITSSGKALTYIIEGAEKTVLKVSLDTPLMPGESREIRIAFRVDIPHCYGRFGWHNGIITLTRWYPLLSVLDKQGWHNYPFYIYHQPFFSDAAYYSLRITVPREETLVSGCTVREEAINPDGTKTVVLESEAPLRDLGLGISRKFSCFSLEQEAYTIQSYYLDGNRQAAEQAAEHAAGLMRFNQERFGAYPYKTFSIVPSFLGFGGDQSSGLIFVDTRLYRLPGFLRRYFDFLVSHETGHQWFYNMVGSDEYREMFLDEGMNSYWLLRYLEEKYGSDAAVLELPDFLRWWVPNFTFRDTSVVRYLYLAKNGYDRPVIGPLSGFTQPLAIFALAYGKGSAILDMLEKKVGQEAFARIIARYTREYRFKNVSLDDLIRIAQEESRQDLAAFFEQWLKTDKTCDFAVTGVSRGRVGVENKGTLVTPVEVTIDYSDGTTQTRQWAGSGKAPLAADPAKKIQRVTIDPDNTVVLDMDRTNNHWPRKKVFTPVPLYFFAYEIPVFLERDAYTTTAGPAVGGSSLGAAVSVQKPYDAILRLSSTYDVSDKELDSKAGYELRHLGNQQNALGFEIFNVDAHRETGDLTGGKVYFRRDLWPINQSVFAVNDHATLYVIRDQKLERKPSLVGQEDVRNMQYREKDEAIAGITARIGRFGPFEDPVYGWRFVPTAESAGHFLGGEDSFWRASAELEKYHLLIPRVQHKIAARAKFGFGADSHKDLFELGGVDGLRGYEKDAIEGSRMLLASAEYRMPLAQDLQLYFLDNAVRLHAVQAVAFVDTGKAWYRDFSRAHFKQDAGAGLRLHFGLAGPLEQLVVRIDVAHAINDPKQDTHVWFGINQSF